MCIQGTRSISHCNIDNSQEVRVSFISCSAHLYSIAGPGGGRQLVSRGQTLSVWAPSATRPCSSGGPARKGSGHVRLVGNGIKQGGKFINAWLSAKSPQGSRYFFDDLRSVLCNSLLQPRLKLL